MAEIAQDVKKIKGVADIIFVIDVTGSMQPCIEGLKNNIHTFLTNVSNYNPNCPVDWRARILGYRDFEEDQQYLLDDSDFVSTPEEVLIQLSALHAEGGGDVEESTLDAMVYAINKSNWRNQVHKIVVVFTDAPAKINFNEKTINEFGIADNIDVLRQLIEEKKIKVFLYAPRCPIYEQMSTFSRLTAQLLDNAEDGLQTLDFNKIMEVLGKTVSDVASQGTVL